MNEAVTPPRLLPRVLGASLDVVILLLLSVVIGIAATGGGAIEVAGIRLRARTVENPLVMLSALVLLRYAAAGWSPFLGRPRWPLEECLAAGLHLVAERMPARMAAWFRRPARALLAAGSAVFLVKALLAWTSQGFFSGDDVEIHEMTLGALWQEPWPIWELRSAFFPMAFIYPAQRLALAAGAVEPESLVFAGRLVVALLSTAVIPLTWLAARRLAPSEPRLAAIAVALVILNKLQMSFGSSELPRPVSTVFVIGAFLAGLRPGTAGAALTGSLLGLAAAFRFSEVVFLPAALATLRRERFVANAVAVLVMAAVTLGAITAVADALYWGQPFSSVAAAIEYTLVARESSRGYEPPWAYLTLIPAWSTALFVVLAVAGSARRHPDTWWLWLPVALLSLLPHKESRYLIPVIPFFAVAAARGFLRAIDWIRRPEGGARWHRWARDLFAPALLLSALHDVGGWRLVRSNEGVRLAKAVRGSQPAGLAGQDIWRLGGRPYLWRHDPLVAITPEMLDDAPAVASAVAGVGWVALRTRTARTTGDAVLAPLGFERDPTWRGEDYVLYARRRR
jgi:hypothetical protein